MSPGQTQRAPQQGSLFGMCLNSPRTPAFGHSCICDRIAPKDFRRESWPRTSTSTELDNLFKQTHCSFCIGCYFSFSPGSESTCIGLQTQVLMLTDHAVDAQKALHSRWTKLVSESYFSEVSELTPLTPIGKVRLHQRPVVSLFPWLWISLILSLYWEMNLEAPSCRSSGASHEVHILLRTNPSGEYIKTLTCHSVWTTFWRKKIQEGLAKKEEVSNP